MRLVLELTDSQGFNQKTNYVKSHPLLKVQVSLNRSLTLSMKTAQRALAHLIKLVKLNRWRKLLWRIKQDGRVICRTLTCML